MGYLERFIESNFSSEEVRANKDSTINIKYCPWCEEHRWKININPKKGKYGVFRCAKCGTAGDVVFLHAKMRGIDYKEAKKELEDSSTSLPSNFSYVASKSKQIPTASLQRRDFIYRGLLAHGYHLKRWLTISKEEA